MTFSVWLVSQSLSSGLISMVLSAWISSSLGLNTRVVGMDRLLMSTYLLWTLAQGWRGAAAAREAALGGAIWNWWLQRQVKGVLMSLVMPGLTHSLGAALAGGQR